MINRLLFALASLQLSKPILAEEMIGVEAGAADGRPGQLNSESSNKAGVGLDDRNVSSDGFSPQERNQKNSSGPSVLRDSRGSDRFYFLGGIWPNSSYFSGKATFGYSINSYASVELSGHYTRFDRKDWSGEAYGPEFEFVIRAANPSMVIPFAGFGPGHEKWRRVEDDTVFSEGQTLTASGFLGVTLTLTDHFGLSVVRKRRRFMYDRPRKFTAQTQSEDREVYSNQIGFHVYL